MFNDSLFNDSLFNSSGPLVPSSGSIYASILVQAVTSGIFSEDQVALSLTRLPPISKASKYYMTITPGEENAISNQAAGIGRYGSGMIATFSTNLFVQLGLDVAYQDRYFLETALRPLVFQVSDTYQMFVPTDSQGNALVEEPVRLLTNDLTLKYRNSPEWGSVSIVFGYKYLRACTTSLKY